MGGKHVVVYHHPYASAVHQPTHACLLQPIEYIGQAVLATWLTVTGKWIAASIHISVCIYNLRTYLRREHQVDVTEIFRQLPKQKMMRMVKLVVYLFAFVLIIYRCDTIHCSCQCSYFAFYHMLEDIQQPL